MKTAARFALLSAFLVPYSLTQTSPGPMLDIHISSGVAEKLLIHTEPMACLNIAVVGEVKGTVEVVLDIKKNGNVVHPEVVSGPALVRKTVLDAVRKYKYKPYLLNGEPVDVETTVAVPIDTIRACPSN